MSQTIELNNYSIVVSLNDRTIYYKITDTVSFYQYEGNVDAKELRLSADLADIYKIMINCLKSENGYSVSITSNSGIIKLQFNALVGGFLKMTFDVLLREKVMSNDSQLTINFNRLEQKLIFGITKLMERCDQLESLVLTKNTEILDLTNKLSYSQICMCHSGHASTEHFIPINIKEITNFKGTQANESWRFDLIQHLYQLEKLTIQNFRIGSFAQAQLKSKSLTTLHIHCGGEGHLTSLQGLNDLPNVENLTITNAPALTNITSVFKSYNCKINYLKIQTCGNVNVVELQTYCQSNNINLEIS